jgi:hypothetical protein
VHQRAVGRRARRRVARAALGGSIEVPTLDGTATIKVPPETQSGRVFRLREVKQPSVAMPLESMLLMLKGKGSAAANPSAGADLATAIKLASCCKKKANSWSSDSGPTSTAGNQYPMLKCKLSSSSNTLIPMRSPLLRVQNATHNLRRAAPFSGGRYRFPRMNPALASKAISAPSKRSKR